MFKGKTTRKQKGMEFDEVWVEGDLIHSGNKLYIHPVSNSVTVEGELGKLIVMHQVIPETVEVISDDRFVSKVYADQIRWERDIAIEQLRELGIGFGERINKTE